MFGRALLVDVGSHAATTLPLDDAVLRDHIGGAGLAAHLLQRLTPDGCDALAPEAPLAFVFSPLVGTPLTTSAKLCVAAKSPLTGLLNDALTSSHFAIAGKLTGHDAIVLHGASEEPCAVIVDGDGVRIDPVPELWGLPAAEAERRLRGRLGSGYRVAAIGPAGERLVRYATLSHDGRHAGRGGHGAVLGAKRVKAVAVRACARVPVADRELVLALAADLRRRSFGPATAKYRELGTLANLLAFNAVSALPSRNFREVGFAGAEALSAERAQALREKARRSCASCSIGCEHIYAGADGRGVRMEYENVFALGPLCGVDDQDAVIEASRLCDELGLDTISAGGTVAWAMECAERGLLDAPWLRFGDGSALLGALREIGERRGLGDLLAEGSRRAAASLGPEALALAPQVKGLELPGYEPRTLQAMALGLAVNARGADHNRSGAYEADFAGRTDRFAADDRSVRAVVEAEDRAALVDSLILCKFLRGVFPDPLPEWARLLTAVTGVARDAGDLAETAERIVALKKVYNVAQGWTREQDTLPARLLEERVKTASGRVAGLSREQLDALVQRYYAERGWDAGGRPTPAQAERLGLPVAAAA